MVVTSVLGSGGRWITRAHFLARLWKLASSSPVRDHVLTTNKHQKPPKKKKVDGQQTDCFYTTFLVIRRLRNECAIMLLKWTEGILYIERTFRPVLKRVPDRSLI